MATEISKTFTTRERFRADLEAGMLRAIAADVTTPRRMAGESGTDVDNVPVITSAAIDRAIRSLFDQPLPPPSHKAAEVRSDAVVTVWAKCPNCKLHMAIPVSLTPQLVLESGVGELKLKAKSKGRIHTCGQMSLDEPNGQLTAFAADGVASGERLNGSDVEDLSDDPDEEPIGEVLGAARSELRASIESLAEPAEDVDDDAPTPIRKTRRSRANAVKADAGDVDMGEGAPNADDAAAIEAARDPGGILECIGSNHVPGCEHFEQPEPPRCGVVYGSGQTCTLDAGHVDGHDDLPF